MADEKSEVGPRVDAMALDLLADAFLDVTGVLVRIDPDATKDLLRLGQERMVAALDSPVRGQSGSPETVRTDERAVWKVGVAIRAAEEILSAKVLVP